MGHLDLNMIAMKSLTLFIVDHVFLCRSLEVWGSPEALARERKLRKKAEIEYRESKYVQFKAIADSFQTTTVFLLVVVGRGLPSVSEINHL